MKRILVAVDLTDNAASVVRAAVELARVLGARIRLFHAVRIPTPQSPVFGVPPVLDLASLVNDAEEFLRGLERAVPEELRDGTCADLGSVAERLEHLARDYAADIVVIGAHEHGLVARALGTTASRIVNRMDRPVYVVRAMPPVRAAAAEEQRAAKTPEQQSAEVARALERLIAVCADGAAGYRCAAGTIKEPERLQRTLAAAGERRDRVGAAILDALRSLGYDLQPHGSVAGAVHRRLLEALAAFASSAPNGIRAILQECLRGERKAIAAFRHALRAPLPPDVRALVETQLAHVFEAKADIERETAALGARGARAGAREPTPASIEEGAARSP